MKKLLFVAGAAALVALAAATVRLGSAEADDHPATRPGAASTAGADGAQGLVLGDEANQPETMEQFLTAVTQDVDRYWTAQFESAGLPEPRVSYAWIPAGMTTQSVCGIDGLGDQAAAYCPGDDTIYVSQKVAEDIYTGALDRALPGSANGYGGTSGDFAVAYIIAHEYAHQVQSELGLYDRYGQELPTMDFELQADCLAGTWAKDAADNGRLEDGDVQEALDAALAVGDFDPANPGHHGTPEQREAAWSDGFESGSPDACGKYLQA
jgi:predicted metalloprotease